MKKIDDFSGKSSKEWTSRRKKIRRNRTTLKNKRGDGKVESNDSPENPDRGETSDIPSLPSGKFCLGVLKLNACISRK